MAEELDPVKIQEKIEKLKNSDFKQQQLKSWRPQQTKTNVCICYGIFGLLFLAVGVILYDQADKEMEFKKRYDNISDCIPNNLPGSAGTVCTVDFVLIGDNEKDFNNFNKT